MYQKSSGVIRFYSNKTGDQLLMQNTDNVFLNGLSENGRLKAWSVWNESGNSTDIYFACGSEVEWAGSTARGTADINALFTKDERGIAMSAQLDGGYGWFFKQDVESVGYVLSKTIGDSLYATNSYSRPFIGNKPFNKANLTDSDKIWLFADKV